MNASPSAAPERPLEIPYAFARRCGVLLMGTGDDGALRVGMRQGGDVGVLTEVQRFADVPLGTVQWMDSKDFEKALAAKYANGDLYSDVANFAGEDSSLLTDSLPSVEDLLASNDEAPVIRLINGLLAEAAKSGASDIHIEPYESGLVIRMRVDGTLAECHRLPHTVVSMVVSRIKVMARLDIAERRVPQDGRIGFTMGGKRIDVRVSTLPSSGGERVVLRLLDKENAGIDLDSLGMPKDMNALFRGALSEPNGIVLVTGPTGSGKTTTLYAGLQILNDGSRSILTVEDPVEYEVEGVGQTQVDSKVGMTFASGLRAILRQDPDVVMVGEIRDNETAEIAIQSALTGHLVLSTVHTNSALGAITRLRDMGIEPFLLASVVRCVLAQRLLRCLCPKCRQPEVAGAPLAKLIGVKKKDQLWRAVGCSACHHTGFRGRVGIFEFVHVTPEIRQLILRDADEDEIADVAFAQAGRLVDAARSLVLSGLTSPEEMLRVVRSMSEENA